MSFKIDAQDKESQARAGVLSTDHGEIQTPIFMPVGTVGSVKGIFHEELTHHINAQIILGNTYHLYLRPGTDIINQAGGLHKFITWDKPILTDSGGYQVYSLADRRKITEEGVEFQSHIDGSRHSFTPENAVDIQRQIGADIIMAFDECTAYPCERSYVQDSMQMTLRWLDRCLKQYHNTDTIYGHKDLFFPIIQGSTYEDLRKESALRTVERDAPGYAIGGLSVGEPAEEMYAMTEIVTEVMPVDKPRYLMGVGTPANILECIARGVDMFDCVMPTRNGRNGMLFTSQGSINIKNKKWENDFSPLDPALDNGVSNRYSKAYLKHLIAANEIQGMQIASIHNLSFYLWLVGQAREHIVAGTFGPWKNEMVEKVNRRL